MTCPLEQLAVDAKRENRVFYLCRRDSGDLVLSPGDKMFLFATCGLSLDESYDVLGIEWVRYLRRRWSPCPAH